MAQKAAFVTVTTLEYQRRICNFNEFGLAWLGVQSTII